jgi:hypothetical protein
MAEAKTTVNAAYHRLYCVAMADRYLSQGTDDNRRVWEGVLAVLEAYTAEANRNPAKDPDHDRLQQFPVEVATHVAAVLGELLTGKMPRDLSALQKGGASKYGPTLMGAINTAVLYVNAARDELLADPAPRQTILTTFGITERTWKDWRKRADPESTDPKRFQPGEDKELRAMALRNALKRAVYAYTHFGGRPDGGAAK